MGRGGGTNLNFAGFAGGDQVMEVVEEGVGVVRAGGGFGVILNREDGEVFVAEAFDGVVVEVDLGDERAAFFEARGVGGEAVVLGGDGDLAGFQVFDGLIAAAVAELEFKGGAADGVGDHLVAEADAEGGELGYERRDGAVHVVEGGGVAGAVGEEEAVGLVRKNLLGGGGGGEDLDLEAVADELAEDGVLGAEIKGGDAVVGRDGGGEAEGRAGGV